MDKPLTDIMVRAGIVPPETIALMERWGMLIEAEGESGEYASAESVVDAIREVQDSGETVKLRDTDLDVIKQYLHGQKPGRLYLKDDVTGEKASYPVFYAETRMKEYVIPWRSESIRELIVEPSSYLKTENGEKVYFSDVRELFYGDQKAFMVCEAAEV